MADTKLRHRAFALTFAILFAFTAVATTGAVIFSIINSNKQAKKASTASSTSLTCSPHCLAGKPLAGFTPVSSVPAIKITDINVGTGTTALATSTVGVQYTGAVASTGLVFQSSLDSSAQPVTFPLGNVIPGFKVGITGMKVGGERQVLIPASMAYGANPPSGSGIPANANLVFNITLLSVQ
jgi:peptidylprolyl isomerase